LIFAAEDAAEQIAQVIWNLIYFLSPSMEVSIVICFVQESDNNHYPQKASSGAELNFSTNLLGSFALVRSKLTADVQVNIFRVLLFPLEYHANHPDHNDSRILPTRKGNKQSSSTRKSIVSESFKKKSTISRAWSSHQVRQHKPAVCRHPALGQQEREGPREPPNSTKMSPDAERKRGHSI